MNPAGGLARRKTTVEKTRAEGPTLLLDAGNALFRTPGRSGVTTDEARARLLLSTMAKLGTFAMAVGTRDLGFGAEGLRKEARAAGLQLLSANLVGPDRKPLFPASAVASAGGWRVGVIGATTPGPVAGDNAYVGLPVVEAVQAEARRLQGKADLVVVLAAVPYADALQLTAALKGLADFVLYSHEGRGTAPAQRNEGNFLLATGERGRMMGKLSLEPSGKGGWVDLDEQARELQMVGLVKSQIAELNRRIGLAKDEQAKRDLAVSVAGLQKRLAEHERAAGKTPEQGARTLKLDWVSLGPDVKGDPSLEAAVAKLEAVAPSTH